MRIGIDLGGTKIEGIILNNDGEIQHKIRLDTPVGDYGEVVESVCRITEKLQGDCNMTVGIGTPGVLDAQTSLMKNSNSLCIDGKPFKRDVESRLGYEIKVENDANCFVLSEALLGAGKDAKCVFGIVLGTGCGGGLVISKKLINGPNGIAGEWGHNCIPTSVRKLIKRDRTCDCGRVNCIETVLSGRGLRTTFAERFGYELEAEAIAAQARLRNEEAKSCIDIYASQLALCLSTIINILDPDMIIFGGGLSNIKSLYQLVPNYLCGLVFSDSVKTKIVPASYGDASGARGAACLWSED